MSLDGYVTAPGVDVEKKGSGSEIRADSAPRDLTLLRINLTEVLDPLEPATLGLCEVHVHADVVLTGDHCGGTAWPFWNSTQTVCYYPSP